MKRKDRLESVGGAHIDPGLGGYILHGLGKAVITHAAHVGCCARNLEHPLGNTDCVLSGTSRDVLHFVLLRKFLQEHDADTDTMSAH